MLWLVKIESVPNLRDAYRAYVGCIRDEMMAERGVALTHTTILRWVQRYVPEFEKCWNKYSRPVGGSWRCDETYIKVKGG
jgi:transposase-like protein